jgi:hypothetical protein
MNYVGELERIVFARPGLSGRGNPSEPDKSYLSSNCRFYEIASLATAKAHTSQRRECKYKRTSSRIEKRFFIEIHSIGGGIEFSIFSLYLTCSMQKA